MPVALFDSYLLGRLNMGIMIVKDVRAVHPPPHKPIPTME